MSSNRELLISLRANKLYEKIRSGTAVTVTQPEAGKEQLAVVGGIWFVAKEIAREFQEFSDLLEQKDKDLVTANQQAELARRDAKIWRENHDIDHNEAHKLALELKDAKAALAFYHQENP